MTFKERYSTLDLKSNISKDISATKEVKDAEIIKTTISNEAFLQAELTELSIKTIELLINAIEQARLSSLRSK